MKHIDSIPFLMYRILFISLSISGSLSCVSPRAEVESRQTVDRQEAVAVANVHTKSISNLQKDVMALHDSLMPAMSKLMHLKRELKIRLQDEKIENEHRLRAMRDAVVLLEGADAAMMTWMRSYKTNYEGMQEAEIKNYLVKEKQQIDEVKQKMAESMQKAISILKKN
jgi:hypothetical protein